MGIVSAITGIISSGKQKKLAKRQARAAEARAKAEKERQRIEQVRANVEARQERLKQVREARLNRARILSSAANSGALGSTATAGALGSIGSQASSNIGQVNQAQSFGGAISTQNEIAADQSTEINRLEGKKQVVAANAQLFNSIGGLAENIFKVAGGPTTLAGGNLFK